MPFRRRRSMRRSQPRAVVQSFKKVLNFAPSSHASGLKVDFVLSLGTDSVAAGQTGVTDAAVPTGSIITEFVIQYSAANLAAVTLFQHISMQRLDTTQVTLSPNVTGGSPQRNQVMFMGMRSIGQGQNMNWEIRYKVPKKFQRVKEGSFWVFTILGTAANIDSCQVIYKFYR